MTKSNISIAVKDSTFELERQDELKDFLQTEGQQALEQFRPGTQGCHELLDRTAMIGDSINRFIVSHPACLQNAEWYALARQAADALHNLYQQVGAEQLEDER
jgi:hypothetical protein